jgi:hypothetical protein
MQEDVLVKRNAITGITADQIARKRCKNHETTIGRDEWGKRHQISLHAIPGNRNSLGDFCQPVIQEDILRIVGVTVHKVIRPRVEHHLAPIRREGYIGIHKISS